MIEVKIREQCPYFECDKDGDKCPTCSGKKWLESWVSVRELLQNLLNVGLMRD